MLQRPPLGGTSRSGVDDNGTVLQIGERRVFSLCETGYDREKNSNGMPEGGERFQKELHAMPVITFRRDRRVLDEPLTQRLAEVLLEGPFGARRITYHQVMSREPGNSFRTLWWVSMEIKPSGILRRDEMIGVGLPQKQVPPFRVAEQVDLAPRIDVVEVLQHRGEENSVSHRSHANGQDLHRISG